MPLVTHTLSALTQETASKRVTKPWGPRPFYLYCQNGDAHCRCVAGGGISFHHHHYDNHHHHHHFDSQDHHTDDQVNRDDPNATLDHRSAQAETPT